MKHMDEIEGLLMLAQREIGKVLDAYCHYKGERPAVVIHTGKAQRELSIALSLISQEREGKARKVITLSQQEGMWLAKADFTGGEWMPTPYTATVAFDAVKDDLAALNEGYTIERIA